MWDLFTRETDLSAQDREEYPWGEEDEIKSERAELALAERHRFSEGFLSLFQQPGFDKTRGLNGMPLGEVRGVACDDLGLIPEH
jgi:hypothetical protein